MIIEDAVKMLGCMLGFQFSYERRDNIISIRVDFVFFHIFYLYGGFDKSHCFKIGNMWGIKK
jgi:hypothetical protein